MKATQPCPCGWYGLSAEDCLCTKNLVDRNLAKISGPLLDRIDLHVPVPALATTEVSHAAQRALEAAMTRLETSVRAHDRVIKVARSIADLAGKEQIDVEEVAEAVTYRCLDRAE